MRIEGNSRGLPAGIARGVIATVVLVMPVLFA